MSSLTKVLILFGLVAGLIETLGPWGPEARRLFKEVAQKLNALLETQGLAATSVKKLAQLFNEVMLPAYWVLYQDAATLMIIYGAFRCDYKYYPKAEGYLKLHRVPANWRDARLQCHLEGAKLASPLNENLRETMKTVMGLENRTMCGIFTGIHSTFSRGDFHSAEGVPLSNIPHTWAEDEPDNHNDKEGCILMLSSGEFADVDCSVPMPYMCYKKSSKRLQVTGCGTTDAEYTFESRTGSCYKFHKTPRTWSRAFMACAAEGGHLVTINSETEAQVIKDMYVKYPASAWVAMGAKKVGVMSFLDWGELYVELLTDTGVNFVRSGYTILSNWPPSTWFSKEYCGSIYRDAQVNDAKCEMPHAFICEKNPDSISCDKE